MNLEKMNGAKWWNALLADEDEIDVEKIDREEQ